MPKQRYLSNYYRHPKTLQEIKANLDDDDLLIRGKRRNLPDSYDDICVRHQKGWKYLRRRKQYHENAHDYNFFRFEFFYNDSSWHIAKNIMHEMERLSLYCVWKYGAIEWFGPQDKYKLGKTIMKNEFGNKGSTVNASCRLSLLAAPEHLIPPNPAWEAIMEKIFPTDEQKNNDSKQNNTSNL